ncbi:predicted protein [Streptomyces sp. C]|nr:predicted protein [Streptomyces sp. C]
MPWSEHQDLRLTPALVAETHAALGLGQMAARREKVSRWESGRTIPEHSAQLAMAHIHHVPATEVCRLGWPHWLYLARQPGPRLRPWARRRAATPEGTTALQHLWSTGRG